MWFFSSSPNGFWGKTCNNGELMDPPVSHSWRPWWDIAGIEGGGGGLLPHLARHFSPILMQLGVRSRHAIHLLHHWKYYYPAVLHMRIMLFELHMYWKTAFLNWRILN